jgi:hypothetical protein
LIKDENVVVLADVLWSLFIGIVQLEERKFAVSKKEHLKSTLEYGFSLIADSLDPMGSGDKRSDFVGKYVAI